MSFSASVQLNEFNKSHIAHYTIILSPSEERIYTLQASSLTSAVQISISACRTQTKWQCSTSSIILFPNPPKLRATWNRLELHSGETVVLMFSAEWRGDDSVIHSHCNTLQHKGRREQIGTGFWECRYKKARMIISRYRSSRVFTVVYSQSVWTRFLVSLWDRMFLIIRHMWIYKKISVTWYFRRENSHSPQVPPDFFESVSSGHLGKLQLAALLLER